MASLAQFFAIWEEIICPTAGRTDQRICFREIHQNRAMRAVSYGRDKIIEHGACARIGDKSINRLSDPRRWRNFARLKSRDIGLARPDQVGKCALLQPKSIAQC